VIAAFRSARSDASFAMYAAVAAVVGFATIGIRELVAFALAADRPLHYAFSVFAAYLCGVVLNYFGQARFTFRARRPRLTMAGFARFALFAVASAAITVMLSHLLRYGLALDGVLGPYAAASAFAGATLLTSVLSFTMNSRFVFAPPRAPH
jgi:putative flippase GtrA